MSPEQSSLPPEPGGRIGPGVPMLALRGMRPSARWATVAAAIVVSAAAAGCSASPASTAAAANHDKGTADLTAVQGAQATAGRESFTALHISLASGNGSAAVGSADASTTDETITATGLSALTYTSTGAGGGLYHPQGVSADNGTVYVSNTGSSVVAAIASGATTLVTGSLANTGETGDGGQASAATVNHPTGTAEDAWEMGTNDPQGLAGGPVLETGGVHDLTFETSYETLYNAGYSVKWYHASGWIGPTDGNYFVQFQSPGHVPEALYNAINGVSTLYGDGTPGGIGNPLSPTAASNPQLAFEEDCANGTLADVSWVGTGESEHPPAIPAAGAQFLASKLEALAANEDLWNSTVFILNYDENDGFFDHVVPPTPDEKEYPEEFVHLASPAGTPGGGLPVGAGFRVPAFVISPWTVGGQIFSDVANHTSCLTLIEAVAAAGGLSAKGPVTFPNLSRWRRATFSDFTAALRPVAAQPAPSNTQFDPATRATELAAQEASSLLPLPPRPAAAQDFPYLRPSGRDVI